MSGKTDTARRAYPLTIHDHRGRSGYPLRVTTYPFGIRTLFEYVSFLSTYPFGVLVRTQRDIEAAAVKERVIELTSL